MPPTGGGLDNLLELLGSRPAQQKGAAGKAALAPRNSNMTTAGTARLSSGGVGGGSDDDLKQLLDSLPDFDQTLKEQKKLLEKHQKRQKAEEARAAAQQRVQRDAAEQAEEEAAAADAAAKMQQLREKLTVGVDLEELREQEAVLQALPPPQGLSDLDLHAGYLEALETSAAELGLDLASQAAAADQSENQVLQEMFLCGLRSGFVRNMALQRGTAGQPLIHALLAIMTQSPDAETLGAAFVTLLALMGEGADAGSSASSNGGQQAADWLMLDAHYGLPTAATGATVPACSLDCIPTDAQLMDALRANGYRPEGAGGSGGGARDGRTQRGATPQRQQAEDEQDAGTAGGEEQEGRTVRLQAIKLILRTAATVCNYCSKHPKSAVAAGALSREGLSGLLLAAVRLGLDPAANQLQLDLDAVAVALLGAFEEADWARKLPQLADRLAEMGPSNAARLKLLKKLPTAHPRGLALQQFAGAVLLERLLPPSKQLPAGKSAVNRREVATLDPAAVMAAQPWFSDPKGLVTGATSGGAQAPHGGYMIGVIELLLKVCHLLLWPHMLTYSQDEPSCINAEFLDGWLRFLVGCQKHIKNMQPEDQAVKVLATYLELEYRSLAEASMPMSP